MTSGSVTPGDDTESARAFTAHRPRLFGLAYRMLGSAEEAEDTVQDAYLRWSGADRASIEHPGAWLAKVVTHLCLTRLTSARVRRERYAGPWLPEPVLTGGAAGPGPLGRSTAPGPLEAAELRDDVSTAFLVLLERLTPAERAVYVLREAFGYAHREIAGVLDLTEAHCRQLYGRAARRLAAPEAPRSARSQPPSEERRRALVESFVAASRDGDLARLERLFAEDVVWWSDGGGRVRAARRPLLGRGNLLRFLAGVARWTEEGTAYTVAEVNGAPGMVVHVAGRVRSVVSLEVRGDRVAEVRMVLNPEKLGYVSRQFARLWRPGG